MQQKQSDNDFMFYLDVFSDYSYQKIYLTWKSTTVLHFYLLFMFL